MKGEAAVRPAGEDRNESTVTSPSVAFGDTSPARGRTWRRVPYAPLPRPPRAMPGGLSTKPPHHAAAMIARKSLAFSEAPPTSAPPTSAVRRISAALSGFTEPP